MRRKTVLLLVLVLPGITVAAQAGAGRQVGSHAQVSANAKAVQHNGQPAIEFEGEDGWGFYVTHLTWQGEPALGFTVSMSGCPGRVFVTRTRIGGNFAGTTCENFDVPRGGATVQREPGKLALQSGSSVYVLIPQMERGSERRPAHPLGVGTGLLLRSLENFNLAFLNVRRLAAQAQAATPAEQPSAAAAKSAAGQPQPGVLNITTDPGDVQVYVNDEPRGLTGPDGRLVLRLPPGAYRLRLSLPGYKDLQQQASVSSGKSEDWAAKLETAGPPPFTAADVSEMLQGKMSPKRVASLVQERGVDFELNPDLEKRLRAIGATSDLLLVIATNDKKK
ncbi:MAG: PEGA domain-containing protein [Terriglobales bacterium]